MAFYGLLWYDDMEGLEGFIYVSTQAEEKEW